MGKQFVNQHIVPKRYLDRFAVDSDRKNIIGTMLAVENRKCFTASTSDVGYIKNYYDVTDKADPKYWEHYFAEEIDTLCGTEMENIISSVMLSKRDEGVLSDYGKEVLSKVIIAQLMRIPSSIEYAKEISPRIEQSAKESVLSILPKELVEKYGPLIMNIKLDEQSYKELLLNHSFAPDNFKKYCQILKSRCWVVFVNMCRNNIPFVTSDNPVLVEGIGRRYVGLFRNGLIAPTTCIFFPLNPRIAVANYSKSGVMSLVSENDGKRIWIDDLQFIMNKDIKIVEQAYQHSFIPQPLFDECKKTIIYNSLEEKDV